MSHARTLTKAEKIEGVGLTLFFSALSALSTASIVVLSFRWMEL